MLLQQVCFRNPCRCNGVLQWNEFGETSLSLNAFSELV